MKTAEWALSADLRDTLSIEISVHNVSHRLDRSEALTPLYLSPSVCVAPKLSPSPSLSASLSPVIGISINRNTGYLRTSPMRRSE